MEHKCRVIENSSGISFDKIECRITEQGIFTKKSICFYETGFFEKKLHHFDETDIVSIKLLEVDKAGNVKAGLGWGALGLVALGPLGLLAGIVGGINAKNKIFLMEFKNGFKSIIACDFAACDYLITKFGAEGMLKAS